MAKQHDIIVESHTDTIVESIDFASSSEGPKVTNDDTLPLSAPHSRQINTSAKPHRKFFCGPKSHAKLMVAVWGIKICVLKAPVQWR